MTPSPNPRLRSTVHAVPARDEAGRELFVFEDPEGLTTVQVAVARPLGELLHLLLDGTRDAAALRADWEAVTNAPGERFDEILAKLDEALLLEGDRVERARRDALEAYRSQPQRPARFAGESYPSDPAELAAGLHRWRKAAGVDPVAGPVRAVLGPHIDPRGGGLCHGAAAAAVEACPAEVYVVLGTAHHALRRPFALTTLDYDTPLGTVPTDRELVERLAGRGGGGLLDAEGVHAREHSVEFQAVWLRLVHAARPNLRIVPVIVGSQHERILAGHSPGDDPAVRDFVAALAELTREYGERLALVASVDLAHVGPHYGDAAAPDEERLAHVLEQDRRLLGYALRVDAEGWFSFLHAEQDARNVCGAAPTYVLLAALADAGFEGDLLRHDAWEIDPSTGSHVSFATVAYRPKETEDA